MYKTEDGAMYDSMEKAEKALAQDELYAALIGKIEEDLYSRDLDSYAIANWIMDHLEFELK